MKEQKYLCVIKQDPENWMTGTLENIKKWILENWDLDTELKLIKVEGDFKETKIQTFLNY